MFPSHRAPHHGREASSWEEMTKMKVSLRRFSNYAQTSKRNEIFPSHLLPLVRPSISRKAQQKHRRSIIIYDSNVRLSPHDRKNPKASDTWGIETEHNSMPAIAEMWCNERKFVGSDWWCGGGKKKRNNSNKKRESTRTTEKKRKKFPVSIFSAVLAFGSIFLLRPLLPLSSKQICSHTESPSTPRRCLVMELFSQEALENRLRWLEPRRAFRMEGAWRRGKLIWLHEIFFLAHHRVSAKAHSLILSFFDGRGLQSLLILFVRNGFRFANWWGSSWLNKFLLANSISWLKVFPFLSLSRHSVGIAYIMPISRCKRNSRRKLIQTCSVNWLIDFFLPLRSPFVLRQATRGWVDSVIVSAS